MMLSFYTISILFVLIAIISYYKHLLILLMYIELILLLVSLSMQHVSVFYDSSFGALYSIFIITIAAAESAIGLALAVSAYKFKSNLFL